VKPWIVDAKDIEFSADVQTFTGGLFHTNNTISRFLDKSNLNELLVVGPKGCGKTLLLKTKRIAVSGSGVSCLPENALVDKPIGTPRIFSKQDTASIMDNQDYWTSIWLIAIIMAISKSTNSVSHLEFDTEQLKAIKDDENYKSACDIFDLLISLSRRDYYSAYDDLRKNLIPTYRNIHSGIYFFIDNIDEYFEVHLGMDQENNPLSGVLEKSFWYYSQIGLASAARQLQGINNHIKICASIRKEVMPLIIDSEIGLQLSGGMLDISYVREDLEDILIRNIKSEDDSNLADINNSDWFTRFVGVNARILEHMSTGEEEPFEEFIIRHSLWRPRDLAVLGKGVSSIPKERRTERNIREEIIRTSIVIARSYIAECKPHLELFDDSIIFSLIGKNVLTPEDLASIATEYDSIYNAIHKSDTECHIFCQLYKIGLLGHLSSSSNPNILIKSFLLPGEGPPEREHILPDSSHYLIHPVLDSFIASSNTKYMANMDSLNIVGKGRAWRDESDYSFVLKGDVCGYSETMNDPELSIRFPEIFENIVIEASKPLTHGSIDGGDSVLLIDKNAINILKAAISICRNLYNSPINKKLRFGGSNGLISITDDKKVLGRTIRTAARIEPYATEGTILVDGNFFAKLSKDENDMRFTEATAETHPHIPIVNSDFDVGKSSTDLQTLVKLYEYNCTKTNLEKE